jgi:hypothetical protein
MTDTRVRIEAAGVLEVEGTEDFVRGCLDRAAELIRSVSPVHALAPPNPTTSSPTGRHASHKAPRAPHSTPARTTAPPQLGDMLHKLADDATDMDRTLCAAQALESVSTEGKVKTREINAALMDLKIKLSNTSLAVRRNRDAKYLIPLPKGFFKVSAQGEARVKEITGQ